MRPLNAASSSQPVDAPPSVLQEIGVQRRAPFGENPSVGARGTKTQQRILAAALDVFGEVGYHGCRVERITEVAGCSRPSFYQYFSSKEDLFRQLAGEVARSLFGVIDAMGTVTPDEAGWQSLRDWLSAYSNLYGLYWPVFGAFAAAEGSDDVVSAGAQRVGDRQRTSLASKIDPSAFRTGSPDVVAGILLNAVNRSHRYLQLLLRIAPERAPDRTRLLDSLADVLHRSLFGRRGVSMAKSRPLAEVTARALDGAVFDGLIAQPAHLGRAGQSTRLTILDAGAVRFRRSGYHDTHVDDIVATAGVARGTFYRYFDNKDAVFRAIAGRSSHRVFTAISSYPDVATDPGSAASSRQLKRWLEEYSKTWDEEGKLFRTWVEAMGRDPELVSVTVRVMDSFRAALGRFLAGRGWGDMETDAFLLLALLDLTHEGPRNTQSFELSAGVLATVIRRGFFGIDARY